ncbi:unnamed protein product [Rhizoctonia solani]|uniref:Peptidase A1 domain-containing protein n=1 Tax=Rhizoctonia solani TaxID=456999 RepID=A0A8H3GNG3_9AGAM|nr:unnamed protein product [Rhizoctonia solani]
MSRFLSRFEKHEKRTQNVELKDHGISYTVKIGIGLPPRYYDLLVDTASTHTWIGGHKRYSRTKTSIKQEGRSFSVEYFKGSMTAVVYKDRVQLSSSLIIPNMEFGVLVVESMQNMNLECDGILGLGPTVLSGRRVTPNNGQYLPTIMDELLVQGIIQQNVFGLSFAPTPQGTVSGELTFGGIKLQDNINSMNWADITRKVPWNSYWGFEQAIKYGDQLLQPLSTGFLDSGTILIYISPQAFETYSKSLPGSKIDESRSKLLEIPQASLSKMKSLSFLINGVSYELTPNAQLWPKRLNTLVGGAPDRYYSVVQNVGTLKLRSPVKLDFIMGYVFMKRFYTAYDGDNSKIGFAYTPSTYADVY